MRKFAVRVALAAACVLTAAANGARSLPDPRLIQLEKGCGVVWAKITKIERVENQARYRASLEIEEVLAVPVKGEWPTKKGDVIELEFSTGYGGQFGGSDDASNQLLLAGHKLLLPVRFNAAARTYESARGEGSIRLAEKVDDKTRELTGKLREVAALPAERRRAECVKLIADVKAPEDLRGEALCEFSWWASEKVPDDALPGIADALEKVFLDPKNGLGDHTQLGLDYAIRRTAKDWEKSTSRRDVWLERISAPFPPGNQVAAVNTRRGDLDSVISELLRQDARALAQVGKVAADRKMPAMWRWSLLHEVALTYCRADKDDPTMERLLNDEFPSLVDDADGWVCRLIATTIEQMGPEAARNGHRAWRPTEPTRETLNRALARMKEKAENPADPEARYAIEPLEQAIKSFEAKK